MAASPRLVIDRAPSSRGSSTFAPPGLDTQTCAVAQLAIEAAAILRTMKALGHQDLRDAQTQDLEETDFPLFREYQTCPDAPTPQYVTKALFKRLYAVRDAAVMRRATSVKGAIFQLYLAGNIAGYVSGSLVESRLHRDDLQAVTDAEEQSGQLLYSAVAALEPLAGDDPDLPLLRIWFFDPRYDALAITDAVIARRATLSA